MSSISHPRVGGAPCKSLPANHSTIGGGGGTAAGIAAVGMPGDDEGCPIPILATGAAVGPPWGICCVIGAGAIMGGCNPPGRPPARGSGDEVWVIGAGCIMRRAGDPLLSSPVKGLTGMGGVTGATVDAGIATGLPTGAGGGILFVVI